MRFFPLLAALLFMTGCATPPPPKPPPLTLNWVGLYDTNASLIKPVGPQIKIKALVPRSRLIARQDRIPAQTGILFGLTFTIPGAKVGEEVALRHVIRFPSPGLTNLQGKLLVQREKPLTARTGHPFTVGYRFDEDWEVKEGEWVFEIWRGEELLLRKPFYVTRNQPVPVQQAEASNLEAPQCPPLSFPKEARQKGAEGQTHVLFTINGNGSTEDVSLLAPSGDTPGHALLDAAVVEAFKSCKFKAVRGVELYYAGRVVNWVLTDPLPTNPTTFMK